MHFSTPINSFYNHLKCNWSCIHELLRFPSAKKIWTIILGNKIVETLIFRNAHSQTGVHGVNAVGSVVLMEQKKELVRFDSHVTRSVPKMAKNQFWKKSKHVTENVLMVESCQTQTVAVANQVIWVSVVKSPFQVGFQIGARPIKSSISQAQSELRAPVWKPF